MHIQVGGNVDVIIEGTEADGLIYKFDIYWSLTIFGVWYHKL